MSKLTKQEQVTKLLEKHAKEYGKLLGTKDIHLALFHRQNPEATPAITISHLDKKLTVDKLAIAWFEITGRMYMNIAATQFQEKAKNGIKTPKITK